MIVTVVISLVVCCAICLTFSILRRISGLKYGFMPWDRPK